MPSSCAAAERADRARTYNRKRARDMSRIEGIDPERATGRVARVLEGQRKTWGQPLANHLIYARRPDLFRGVRGMWSALDNDHILGPALVCLVNRRVAALNGCAF
jgi:hypothetical protein